MQQLYIRQGHRDEVEPLCDALEELGALSVTLTDQYDDPILEPAPGAAPLWPHVVIQALYEDEALAEHAAKIVCAHYPHVTYSIDTLPEEDWERTCLEHFKPQQFGARLWVCPSWLPIPDPHAVNLILDPGLAFGTGTHPTTSLCLTWLDAADVNQKQVIDYGCGSGILALAALKLGAAHVHAVDIDAQALLATHNNALTNGVLLEQLTVSHPDALPANASVDLVIANILLTPLIELQHRFRALLKEQGTLVVSGILANQQSQLIAAYEAEFVHLSSATEGDWASLTFKPRT